jgi:hypothetical protein
MFDKLNDDLTNLFKQNGWHSIKNDDNWIIFIKAENETEFFEIKVDNAFAYVSIPLKNSVYQYQKKFNNYLKAYEYVEERFKEFIIPIDISI